MSRELTGIRPAKRTGLAGEVAVSIRQAIFDGVIKVGDRLGEVEIAQQLDVSRGPVREALVQLRQEGLVSLELHRGASVITLSPSDVLELATLRTTLESFAIERAALLRTEDDLASFRRIIREMTVAVEAADEHRLTQLDIAFHDAVYLAAKHDRLTNAWGTIRSQMLLFLLTRAKANQDYLTIAVAEHTELLELIESGDATGAREALSAHASGAYDRLVQTYSAEDRAAFSPLDASVSPSGSAVPVR